MGKTTDAMESIEKIHEKWLEHQKNVKYLGELGGKVYPRWLENYMTAHKIPDVALELRENRLIAHAVVV